MSRKNKVVLLVVIGILALVQLACSSGNPDPNYSGSNGQKLDQQIVATVQAIPTELKAGLSKAQDTCFSGLATGNTDKITHSPCSSPLP